MLALLKRLFRKSFFFFFFRDLREMALPKAKEIIVSGGKVKACSPDLFNCFVFPSTTIPAMYYGLWEPDADRIRLDYLSCSSPLNLMPIL